jgi:hypothetical protein
MKSRITGTLALREGCEQDCQYTHWAFPNVLLLPNIATSKKMAGKWELEWIQRVNLLQASP